MKWCITYSLLILTVAAGTAQVYVNHNATGNNDGTSWSNAYVDLQNALDAAAPGSQLWIAAGTYVPDGPTPDGSHFSTLKALEFYGGFAGTENSLEERDLVANSTILSGDKNGDDVPGDFLNNRTDNAHHVLIINAPIGETVIDGLLFKGGMTRVDAFAPDATDVPYHRWRGGGLYIYESASIVRNCTFRDNYGTQGTGFYAAGYTNQSGGLTLENSLFELNDGVVAGACWIAGWNDAIIRKCIFQHNNSGSHSAAIALGNMNATIEDCLFDQNTSSSQGGASLLYNNNSSLISQPTYLFSRCVFTANSAPTGGGIRFNNFFSSFSLAFDSCSFIQNIATNSFGSGGALYIVDYADEETNELTSTVRIDRTTFTSNTATYGGAIEIDCGDDSLRIEVAHSGFFSNSSADSGGGLYVWMLETSNVHTQIENSTFDGNIASVGAGLILDSYYNVERMSYEIDSSNFSNNIADSYGGAIGQFRTEGSGLIGSIRNSQFVNNEAPQAGALISLQETLQVENCLFRDNYAEGYDGEIIGGGAIIFEGPSEINVRNSIFERNNSDVEGSAVFSNVGVNARYDNVLFNDNIGVSTLANGGSLHLVNATMANNDAGLFLQESSTIEIQNSIFDNTNGNLRTEGTSEVISNGGNISNDATMTAVLTGNGSYDDLHNTDPLLGPDFVPLAGSPAIDAGNLQGIKYPFDLAGNSRVQGATIDAGSYESFLVATQDAHWNTPAFTVYPNPVQDVLHFELDMDWIGDIGFVLFNYLGQPVHRARMVKSTGKQSFSEGIQLLTPGEYVVMLVMGENSYAVNIIVQP